jgi:hypothetical protein
MFLLILFCCFEIVFSSIDQCKDVRQFDFRVPLNNQIEEIRVSSLTVSSTKILIDFF